MHHKESGEKAIPDVAILVLCLHLSFKVLLLLAIESFGPQNSLLLHAFVLPA
jgi:hypothetical protein